MNVAGKFIDGNFIHNLEIFPYSFIKQHIVKLVSYNNFKLLYSCLIFICIH
jgi:hypothetical protein